jgi:alpha-glucosidase
VTTTADTTSATWWQDAVVYHVYIRSFADSNGDGVGDLEGIRSKLPYLSDLGVDAVWITPFYPSPMHDHGYDVADYCDIDPLFGSLDDFDKLLVDAHALSLRVIIDIVPNHTSNEHAWFRNAVRSNTAEKRDWYIFRPPAANGGPPNNWESVFGGPAWTLDEASGDYYLHLFDKTQPDLNWRNTEVHEAFRDVLRFWLDRGVDGFRIDVAHGLCKDAELRDNVKPGKVPPGTEHLHSVGAGNCWDQPETQDIWRDWRRVADEYDDRMFVGEVFLYDMDRVATYVGSDRLHQAFNFLVAAMSFNAAEVRRTVQRSLELFHRDGTSPTWVLSNHDLVRHVTRYGGGDAGRRRGRAMTALLLGLPGSPYIYQGEELGLEQSDVAADDRQDPIWVRSGIVGRDGCRTPVPWTAQSPGHGFSTGKPWLPFDEQALARNVECEGETETGTLRFYGEALRLRRAVLAETTAEAVFLPTSDQVVALCRGPHVIATNFGSKPARVSLSGPVGEVLLTSDAAPAVAGSTLTVPAETTVWATAGPPEKNSLP